MNNDLEIEAGNAVMELLELLVRKVSRPNEAGTRVAALCGDTKAQSQVLAWDEEDGLDEMPDGLPNGDEFTTVGQLAAALNLNVRVAAMMVTERPGKYPQLHDEAVDILTTANQTEQNNVFVALLPDEDYAGIPDGVPEEELHLTLFYSSPLEDGVDISELLHAINNVRFREFEAETTGVTVFPAHDAPRSPVVELVSSPVIEDLRASVRGSLMSLDIRQDRKFGYIPHITLGYVKGNEVPKSVKSREPSTVRFTRMLVTAPGFREEIELPSDVAPTQDELETKPTTVVEG